MSFKVFISYSTKDFEVVAKIRSLLEHSMVEVFVAEHSVALGESLPNRILSAIKACNAFVLLWSSNSKESEWVLAELGIAIGENKTVMPVLLDAELNPPGFLKDIKYLDAHSNVEDALALLKDQIFKNAEKKHQVDGLAWLGLAAAILYLISGE